MSADHPSVLIIEDESAQREVLVYNLEAEGYALNPIAADPCPWVT